MPRTVRQLRNLGLGTLGLFALLALLTIPVRAADSGLFKIEWTKVAENVWVGGRTADALRYPVVANTSIVIGDDGALVFDGGGFVAQGEQVLAKLRSLTKKPLKYIVVSHWHGDHHRGIAPLVAAYPDVVIVSHDFTRAAIVGPPMQKIDKAEKDGGAKDTAAAIKDGLDKNQFFDGSPLDPGEKPFFERFIADNPEHVREIQRMKIFPPTLTFADRITLYLGKRQIDLVHFGPGNTKGDAVMIVPDAGFIAAGDVVIEPVPYGFGAYPKDWASVLRHIEAIDFKVLVPGHGAIQHDHAYLDLLIETLDSVASQVDALIASGVAREDGLKKLDFSKVEERFTNNDPVRRRLFSIYFKGPIGPAAWNAATGVENESLKEEIEKAPN